MNFKKYGILLALSSFLSYCSHDDHSDAAYECKVESFTFDGSTKATSCETLPNELKAKVENLQLASGETLDLYFHTTDFTAGGFKVSFTSSQVSADIYGSGKSATSESKDFTSAQSVCIEIHDITSEAHIIVYDGEDCSTTATKLVNHDEDGATIGSVREVRYNGTSSASLAELHITSSSGGHSHSH